MDETEATRGERFWLAFGLACLPCTAAFLVSLGGIGLGLLLTWQGLLVFGALAAVAGIVGLRVMRRRRVACGVAP
ncbi:MAG: hypothetical protein AABX89_01825 [Candidatus Thermoplasmatota archaeon]